MSKIKLEDLKYVGPEKDTQEVVEEVVDPLADTVDEVEEVIEEVANDVTVETEETNITPATEEKVETTIVKVVKLPIYPTPSTNSPARIFTGNVEIIGKIDRFDIVKYVRSGYGPVKGYTLGIKLVQ